MDYTLITEGLKEDLRPALTVEDVLKTQYKSPAFDKLFRQTVHTYKNKGSHNVVLGKDEVAMFTDKRIALVHPDHPRTRKKTEPRTGFIKNKFINLGTFEKIGPNSRGIHLISTNYPKLMNNIQRIIKWANSTVEKNLEDESRGIVIENMTLSLLIETLNDELTQICDDNNIPGHAIFIADATCNEGLKDDEYLKDSWTHAFGKRTRKPRPPKKGLTKKHINIKHGKYRK
jgi:hypothetical protein